MVFRNGNGRVKRCVRSARLSRCAGTSIVELGMVVPVLMLLVAGTVDYSRWYLNKAKISRILVETSRYASGLSTLEACSTNCSVYPGHATIATRLNSLLSSNGFDTSTVTINTAYYTTASAGVSDQQRVMIKVNASFSTLFGFSWIVPSQISTTMYGPYTKAS